MQDKPLSLSLSSFLEAHGAGNLSPDCLTDLGALVRVFQKTVPSDDPASLSEERLAWLSAMLGCMIRMDQRIYEHYRALVDLFRAEVFRLSREKLLAEPAWAMLCEKAVEQEILPGDLYGSHLPHPHIGLSDSYLRLMKEACL